jgi:PAS domain S-box-containing protein
VSDSSSKPEDPGTKLAESEERFQLLVDAVKDYAIFMLDPDGKVLSWNDGARRLKGYEASEIIGRHFSVFYPQEDIVRGTPANMLSLALRRGRLEVEGIRVRKDGSRFFADVIITPIYNSVGQHYGFAKVTRDITERVEAERQLLEAKREAERASRAKTDFLGLMSHELRTPLNAIIGFSDLLLDIPADQLATTPWRTYVQHISAGGTQLLTLVNDTLDMARIESGRLELDRQIFDVANSLREPVAMVTRLAELQSVRLTADIPEHLEMRADSTRFNQVVTNLLTNAIKFTPPDGTVHLKVWAEAADLMLSVSDTGIGIAPTDHERVFVPFEQVRPMTHTAGAGLGLSIVRRIMEAHGGSVVLTSVPGQGSCFICRFPRAVADMNQPP